MENERFTEPIAFGLSVHKSTLDENETCFHFGLNRLMLIIKGNFVKIGKWFKST